MSLYLLLVSRFVWGWWIYCEVIQQTLFLSPLNFKLISGSFRLIAHSLVADCLDSLSTDMHTNRGESNKLVISS